MAFDDLVEMSGKRVTSRIDVDRGGESLDVYGFLYPPLDPVLLAVENGDILFAEVMVALSCMLKHGRFVFAKCVNGCRGVLLEARFGGSLRFSDISAWARCRVGASPRNVVDEANGFLPVKLVFRLDMTRISLMGPRDLMDELI